MELAQKVLAIAQAQRVVALDAAESGTNFAADFEGTVTGIWEGIDKSGAGLVSYDGKTYKSVRLGITSLFKGSRVQLSYVKGVYYSNW